MATRHPLQWREFAELFILGFLIRFRIDLERGFQGSNPPFGYDLSIP